MNRYWMKFKSLSGRFIVKPLKALVTSLRALALALDAEGTLIMLGLGMLFAGIYSQCVWLALTIVGSLMFMLGVMILRGGK